MSYQMYLIVNAIIAALVLIVTIVVNVKKKKEGGEETVDIFKYLLSFTDKFVTIAEQIMAAMEVNEADLTKEKVEENKKELLSEMINIIVTSSDELGLDITIFKSIPDDVFANIIYQLIENYLPTMYTPEAFDNQPKETTPVEEAPTVEPVTETTGTTDITNDLNTFYQE